MTLAEIAKYAEQHQLAPQHQSGHQELLENLVNLTCSINNRIRGVRKPGQLAPPGISFKESRMYIGIDLGTSGVKAILLNEQGDVVASHTRKHRLASASAVVGTRPEQWWQATDRAMKALGEQHSCAT
jgi:activator of 2-hydroxyglutaryl-CoA dehydratase